MNTASRLRLPLASCSQVPRRRKATPGVPSTKQVPFDLRATQLEGFDSYVDLARWICEEFHQWTAEDERLQSYVDRALQNAWIDSEGIIELYEEIDYRPIRKTIWAQMETVPDELGQPRAVFDEKNQPQFVKDERGKYAEVEPPIEGQPIPQGIAQMEIDSYEPVRVGPGYSVIDYRDL